MERLLHLQEISSKNSRTGCAKRTHPAPRLGFWQIDNFVAHLFAANL
jgi:hypothetical protein